MVIVALFVLGDHVGIKSCLICERRRMESYM